MMRYPVETNQIYIAPSSSNLPLSPNIPPLLRYSGQDETKVNDKIIDGWNLQGLFV